MPAVSRHCRVKCVGISDSSRVSMMANSWKREISNGVDIELNEIAKNLQIIGPNRELKQDLTQKVASVENRPITH